ncbi:M23 family metallopeptidase [Candidatus Peregrinibacteria bacterium]|nr:M23 family metallopeptidase [Candidatus Peregrinibacteria bacterium]
MHIDIDIPRPYLTVSVLVSVVWFAYTNFPEGKNAHASVTEIEVVEEHDHSADVPENMEDPLGLPPLGGDLTAPAQKRVDAEENIRIGRSEQALLERREEILRYQLHVLEQERRALGDDVSEEVEEQFREATRTLTALLQDQKTAEQFLLESFNQLWEAEGRALALGRGLSGQAARLIRLKWPVDASRGISADFEDPEYEKLFGVPHKAIDIRVPQGSQVRSAAAGTVREVRNNGLGFNYLTIEHDDGAVTLYGHLSEFHVQEGDSVRAGEDIGLSGGMPGLPGGGFSTGPHLHLELMINGAHVDPALYLP